MGTPDPGPFHGSQPVMSLAEDPEQGWEQMAPFFCMRTTPMGRGRRKMSGQPLSERNDTDELRATGATGSSPRPKWTS